MNIISYDPYTDTLEQGKIEIYPDPYKTYNKTNWGQMALDMLKENRKKIEETEYEETEYEDFYIVKFFGNLYLVKATSIKEAKGKVWNQYIEPLNKNLNQYDFSYYSYKVFAIKVSNCFDNETDIVCLR